MNDSRETAQKHIEISQQSPSHHESQVKALDDRRKSLKDYIRAGGSFCGAGETLDIRDFVRSVAVRKQPTDSKRKGKMVEIKRKSQTVGKVSARDLSPGGIRMPSLDVEFDMIEGIDYYELKPYHLDQMRGERLRTLLKRDRKLNARMEAFREKSLIQKEKETAAAALVLNEVKKPMQKRSLGSGREEKDSFMRAFSRSGSRLGSFSKFGSIHQGSWAKGSLAASFFKTDRSISTNELDISEHPRAFTKRFEPDYEKLDVKLFKVRLQETETMYLYEYESIVADVNSELGTIYKLQNETAAALTLEDAPQVHEQSTQIIAPPRMDRAHQIPELSLVNAETNVCYSQILDALAQEAVNDQVLPPPLSDDSSSSVGDIDDIEDSKGGTMLLSSPEFQRTYERLLRTMDSLHFNQKQLIFHQKMLVDPFSTSAEFSYEIQLLWMFKNEQLLLKNLKVVSLCWNPINVNVLAVGYAGNDFNFGYVCVWNVKHISKFDRSFKFKSRVTYIEFSTEYPSLLAVAFESGGIAVVNISWKRLFVVNSKPGHIFSGRLPVWQFSWMKVESGEEVPITCGHNGFMYYLRKDVTFAHSQLLVLSHKQKNLKGIHQPEPTGPLKTERPGITCMARHPTDRVSFLAGTTDGCVHVCSTNFRNQHLDAFAAHLGAVRGIKFHPHLEHLFLTFGDDRFIRIWAYGVFLPVFSFSSRPEFVNYAVWSPANAEIFISISGTFLDIWDMRRDLARPVRTWENPKGLVNTRVIFDQGGYNVTVGDMGGNVIVSGLRCVPFSHLLPRKAAARAIEKVLLSLGEHDVLQKLRNIGSPFGECEDDDQHGGLELSEEESESKIHFKQYLLIRGFENAS